MTDNKKKTHLVITGRGGGGSGEQVQADWNQTDDTQVDYIKNKPTIPAAPVQSDWNEADSSSLAYINNKPTIPPQQWFGTQAEYDLIDPKDPSVIYNIEGSDNVQADWNQSDSSADDYIKNKPAMTTETLTFTLQGGTVVSLEVYVKPDNSPYFYVEDVSGAANTLSIYKIESYAPTVEVFYSTDQQNWYSMGTTSDTPITATIPANGKLYLKANIDSWGENLSDNFITASGSHNVGGNIMSLLYGDNYRNQTTFPTGSSSNFENLFNFNTTLVSAEDLILPATTLTGGCYSSMFQGCSSLTTAPATLPATTLEGNCYDGMFNRCTALTTAPVLPATTLAISCYMCMFDGCTSLVEAPELPAQTLEEQCYMAMFNGCTSLNKMSVYATDISAMDCTSDWLSNVAATGDFYNLGGATYTSGDPSGIPSGWTEHTTL